jgi:release factor glutamine methyltransferase
VLKSIAEVLPKAIAFLSEHRIERARRSAEDLLAAVLGLKRMDLYLQYDRLLVESELEKMRAYLKRRSAGEPVEYIIQEVAFYGCQIEVTPYVLIPRPETEILVDLAVKEMKERGVSEKNLWDLCTGSGCIGLAVKKALPAINLTLSDVCPNALDVAKRNSAKNHLFVEFKLGDLLEPFVGQKADFVICNPPYISVPEWEGIDRSVRDHEPEKALLAGEKGTEFYTRLSRELPRFLNPHAAIFFEIGCNQGRSIQEIFDQPPYLRCRLLKDWAGHDRFFFLEIE